jgi:tRNA(fMet)-specific endonuclease VapC
MFLYDSDVLIDFLRGAEPAASYVRDDLLRGRVCVSAMTVFELRAGARSERQQQAVEALLAATQIVPVDGAIAKMAGDWFRDLKAKGQETGAADCLIGATCATADALLVTRNRRHFERMPEVKLSRLAGG